MTTIANTHVTIDTTVPTLSIGQIQLSADKRSTKDQPLTDSQRIRRVVLPAGHWTDFNATLAGTSNQSLTDLLRSALTAIGSDYLRDALTADPLLRTLPLTSFTVPALLAWNNEAATSRSSITFTREQIEQWLPRSATLTSLLSKWTAAGKNPKQLKELTSFVTTRFATLAAKNHGLKEPSDVAKLLSLLDPADLDGSDASLVTEIMGRLGHIDKQLSAKASEATVSMDDI